MGVRLQKNEFTDYTSQFLSLSHSIVDFGVKAGVSIIPYRDPSLPLFTKLPVEKQKLIIEALATQVRMFEMAEKEGISFRSNKQILWHAIKSLGLTPCSDICDRVTDEDILEIHWLADKVQLFHSFSFYEKSSYTIEEIRTTPWENLYQTDPSTFGHIFGMVDELLTGQRRQTYNPNIPKYTVQETQSVFQFLVEIEYLLTSPLFDKNGNVVATVSVERIEILNQRLSTSEEEAILSKRNNLHVQQLQDLDVH